MDGEHFNSVVCTHIISRDLRASLQRSSPKNSFIKKPKEEEVGGHWAILTFVINPRLALTFLDRMIPRHKRKHL